MAFYNKYTPDELLWLLLRAARGETVPELTETLNSLSKSERALTDLFFSKVIDQQTFNTPDYQRFRRLLVDWNSAHKTITASSTKMSDPRVMTNDDLDELFRSFGFNYSTSLKGPTSDPLPQKVNLFLDLVNLYKKKGTPQSILEVLQYFGVTQVDIFEFFLQFDKTLALIFKGDVITGTTISPTSLIYPYDTLTIDDPHWLLTEDQIRSLHSTLKINLPSKTNYLGVRPVATADGPEFSIYSRLIQDQYYDYKFRGITPPQNAEISMIGEVHSLLELHLSTLYVFNKLYNVGSIGDQFVCYDGTSTEIADIIDEYDAINVRPISRIQREVQLRQYYDKFCRLTPRNFLQTRIDPVTVLNEIDPTVIPSIDAITASLEEILFVMLKDIANWIRNNVGYGFINFGFIIFGLDAFFSDLKQVINFFKPYRARLLFLEALQIKSPLFESINIEEEWEHYPEINVIDRLVADSHPCCVDNVDFIDSTSEMCFDSTVSFHSREYFDCGSFFDIGAATDNNKEVFIKVDQISNEYVKCRYDSTAEMTHVILNPGTELEDLQKFMVDSTSAEPLEGDSATVLVTSGLGDFDYGGCFDNFHGFEQVFITIEKVGGVSISSSSTSSSSTSISVPDSPYGIISLGVPPGHFTGHDVIETTDGNYLAVGDSYDTDGERNDYITAIKFNMDEIIWSKQYKNSSYLTEGAYGGYPANVVEVADGYTILTRELDLPDNWTVSDTFLKIDTTTGDLIWDGMFSSPNADAFPSPIKSTLDNGYVYISSEYVNPDSRLNGERYISTLVKLNSVGSILFTRYFVTDWGMFNYVEPTPDGGYITAISEKSDSAIPDYGYAPIISKLDSNGHVVWSKWVSRGQLDHSDIVQAIHRTTDGGYILLLTGKVYWTSGPPAGWRFDGLPILKLDSSGNIVWQKIVTNGYVDTSYADQPQSDVIEVTDGYIFTCLVDGGIQHFIKLDLNGNVTWRKQIDGASYGTENYTPKIMKLSDGLGISFNVYDNLNSYGNMVFVKTDDDGNIPDCPYILDSTTEVTTTIDFDTTSNTLIIVDAVDSTSDPELLISDYTADKTDLCPPGPVQAAEFILMQSLTNNSSPTHTTALIKLSSSMALAGVSDPINTATIYKSTNNGGDWSLVKTISVNQGIGAFCDLGSGVVLAGICTPSGIVYKSTDYGDTWNATQTLAGVSNIHEFASLGGGVVVASTQGAAYGQIWKSTNSGDTWTLVQSLGTTDNQAYPVISLGGGILLAGACNPNADVYRSTDSGDTWTLVRTLGTESFVKSMITLGSGVVIAGTAWNAQIWKSTDYGLTWSMIQRLGTEMYVDSLVYASEINTIYAGTTGGGKVFKSTDNGNTWVLVQRLGYQQYVFSLCYMGGGYVLAGTGSFAQVWRCPILG
jgi:photosystem II stability/assembly factor-like uncharacterized protein